MKAIYISVLTLSIFCFPQNAVSVECEKGWVAYKDELCIQAFPTLLTYDEAKEYCSSQSVPQSQASLVMVKEADIQDLLVNYTNDIYDNVWLGGRYNQESARFQWLDGTPLSYTNWQEGSPTEDVDSNICIEMRPIHARSTSQRGKWTDVNCNKRNLVICQRGLSWSLQDAIYEIIRVSKELEETKGKLEGTEEQLEETKEKLETVPTRVFPVGFIYIEYNTQPSPRTIWPDLTWEDVSSTYAGLFFRAEGGDAAGWGTRQTACSPRITAVQYNAFSDNGYATNPITIPESGTSLYVYAGYHFDGAAGTVWDEGLRFTATGCEVRPVNQAVRIWKRIA